MRKRGIKPRGAVSIKWSSGLAYAVGLLATDGSLSKDGYHLDLTSKDRSLLVSFQDCLGLHHIKIGKKKSGRGSPQVYYRVQFGDVLFYKWLTEIGLTPNKSKTLAGLDIPDQFFFDFLRGCWDGDGSIYAFWDPRWRSSYMFYLGFTGASRPFLIWLQKNTKRLAGVNGQITSGVRAYQLRFAKAESRVLLDNMFYGKGLPHLSRKFTKAQKIIKIDDDNKAQVQKLVDWLG